MIKKSILIAFLLIFVFCSISYAIFCTQCGKENKDSATFCYNCGTKLANKTKQNNISNENISKRKLKNYLSNELTFMVKRKNEFFPGYCLLEQKVSFVNKKMHVKMNYKEEVSEGKSDSAHWDDSTAAYQGSYQVPLNELISLRHKSVRNMGACNLKLHFLAISYPTNINIEIIGDTNYITSYDSIADRELPNLYIKNNINPIKNKLNKFF